MSEPKNGRYVEENGEIRWFRNDILHRTDGPAIEYPDGSQVWFSNGVRHRSGEPAYIGADGSEEWWVRGVNIGKQIFIFQKFIFMLNLDSQKILKEYLVNGMRHNENGHAVMYFNGTRAWYLNGILHRIDGPALLFQDGRVYGSRTDFHIEKMVRRLHLLMTVMSGMWKVLNTPKKSSIDGLRIRL